MKRNSKALILFLAAALLAGCANNSTGAEKTNANRGNAAANDGASKTVAKLKPVEGATIGSVSYYVEDRKAWKDFVHCFQNRTRNQLRITKNVAETTYFGAFGVYD